MFSQRDIEIQQSQLKTGAFWGDTSLNCWKQAIRLVDSPRTLSNQAPPARSRRTTRPCKKAYVKGFGSHSKHPQILRSNANARAELIDLSDNQTRQSPDKKKSPFSAPNDHRFGQNTENLKATASLKSPVNPKDLPVSGQQANALSSTNVNLGDLMTFSDDGSSLDCVSERQATYEDQHTQAPMKDLIEFDD